MRNPTRILNVERLEGQYDESEVIKIFDLLDNQIISTPLRNSPWPTYPYQPKVEFKIGSVCVGTPLTIVKLFDHNSVPS